MQNNGFLKNCGKFLIIFFAYIGSGKLMLLLAIDPGYASPFWAPAGVALSCLYLWGARLWPAVAIGSILTNLPFDQNVLAMDDGRIWIALGIAVGSTLQAVIGSLLLKKYLGHHTSLDSPRSVFVFLVLSGPISCLISSTGGTTTLLLFKLISKEQYLFTWLTWWIGDIIGSVIFTPFIFVFFAKHRELWRDRFTSVILPTLPFFIISVIAYQIIRNEITDDIRNKNLEHAHQFIADLQEKTNESQQVLQAIVSFYSGSQNVERSEFTAFTKHLLKYYNGIESLEWAPLIKKDEVKKFIAKKKAEGFHNFFIKKKNKETRQVEEDLDSDLYLPIDYVVPAEADITIQGYNLWSSQKRREAIISARDTGKITGTSFVNPIQDQKNPTTILNFIPIYKNNSDISDEKGKRDNFLGVAIAMTNFKTLIEETWKRVPSLQYAMEVFSEEVPDRRIISLSNLKEIDNSFHTNYSPLTKSSIDAGKELTVIFYNKKSPIPLNLYWQIWGAIIVGMAICILLMTFLLILTGRFAMVEQLVEERTSDLEKMQTEKITVELILQQSQKMESVGLLASGVAHDFNNLLGGIMGYATILQETLPDDPTVKNKIDTIVKLAERGSIITSQLLNFAKRRQSENLELFDLTTVINEAALLLIGLMPKTIEIKTNSQPQLHMIKGNFNQIFQIIMNLSINARDAMSNGGQIFIQAENQTFKTETSFENASIPAGKYVKLSIADTGEGIPQTMKTKIFEPFFTTKAPGKGTGIGLSVVWNIIKTHGAFLRITDNQPRGTIFSIYFKAEENKNG